VIAAGSGMAEIVPLRLKDCPGDEAVIVVASGRVKGCPGVGHPVARDVLSVGPVIVRPGVPHTVPAGRVGVKEGGNSGLGAPAAA